MKKLQVYAALSEDLNQGWVWVAPQQRLQRSVVKLRNAANGCSVYCEALTIDDNFLRHYNLPGAGRRQIENENTAIVLSQWYRFRLGDIKTKEEAEIEVIPVAGPCAGIRAALHHPQVPIRLATGLAIWSVFLGVAGLVLALISLCKH